MKIILEGQYKYSLFKEFTDDFGVSNRIQKYYRMKFLIFFPNCIIETKSAWTGAAG
jgi:hypothetical protein